MTKKTKQIGYLTAMVISVGSTIGAGIFFKNSSIFANAHGQLGFMIASWIIAAVGVLAIALSLVELTSASEHNGITEVTNKFTKKGIAKFISSYMILVYLPLNFFAISMYAALSLQTTIEIAGGADIGGWGVAAFAFAFFLWFIITGYFKKRLAINSQMLFTFIKYLPLIVVICFSFVQMADNGFVQTSGIKTKNPATGLTSISPWLGIMASIPAILFAYDGFYTVTAVKSDLKPSSSIGVVIVLAISVITATYLAFGILTGLAGAPGVDDIKLVKKYAAIGTIIHLCITFAVFGIINGFALSAPEVYFLTYKEHPIGLTIRVKKLFKIKDENEKNASWTLAFIISLLYFVVIVPTGIYAADKGGVAGLGSLTDWVSNYAALFVFAFIGMAIFGGLINRITNKVTVTKSKFFIPAAIVAIVFLMVAAIYMISANIVGMTGYGNADSKTETIKFVIFIATGFSAAVPTIFDATIHLIKKHKIQENS